MPDVYRTAYIVCPGGPVACNSSKSNDTNNIDVTSCSVSHSSNVVPHFICSRDLSNKTLVTSAEIRQKEATCPVDNPAYNSTKLIVNDSDLNNSLECVVQYRSPGDPSHVYLTEQFNLSRKVKPSDVQDEGPTPLLSTTGIYVYLLFITPQIIIILP